MPDAPNRPLITTPDQGEALWFGPNRTRIVAEAQDTGGAYGLLHSWVPVGSSPPLHLHHAAEEAFYVLEGELRVVCGSHEFRASAGAFVLLPRGVPHTFIAEGDRDAHVLIILSPGGSERFFADAGRPAEGEGLPPATAPDISRLSQAGPAHGIEILGPPLRLCPSSVAHA